MLKDISHFKSKKMARNEISNSQREQDSNKLSTLLMMAHKVPKIKDLSSNNNQYQLK
jgi:hypothetical protein